MLFFIAFFMFDFMRGYRLKIGSFNCKIFCIEEYKKFNLKIRNCNDSGNYISSYHTYRFKTQNIINYFMENNICTKNIFQIMFYGISFYIACS